jgi:hypothetical protein
MVTGDSPERTEDNPRQVSPFLEMHTPFSPEIGLTFSQTLYDCDRIPWPDKGRLPLESRAANGYEGNLSDWIWCLKRV